MAARFDIQWIRAAANQACLRPMLPDAFNNGLKCAFIAEISRAEMPKKIIRLGVMQSPFRTAGNLLFAVNYSRMLQVKLSAAAINFAPRKVTFIGRLCAQVKSRPRRCFLPFPRQPVKVRTPRLNRWELEQLRNNDSLREDSLKNAALPDRS